ncbi:MAG TPA: hypothetical protein VIL05_09400 [Thermoclostridium sp.]
MKNEDKKSNKDNKMKGFERYLEPCPNCGKDILYHMTRCPYCNKEVTLKYYKPMDPEKAKKIKLVLAVIGFIIVFIILLAIK